MKMLTWYIGVKTQFLENAGKQGKNFRKYPEPELWTMLEETYANANYENTWEALFTMCNLFRRVALSLAAHLALIIPTKMTGESVRTWSM
jgi:aminoglycoside 6-adenylyltransferase